MSNQPVLAIALGGLAGPVSSDNTLMLKQFLLRLRSFSLGYSILSIIYVINSIYILSNNDDNNDIGLLEILISFFFILASILIFRISLQGNLMTITTNYSMFVIFR